MIKGKVINSKSIIKVCKTYQQKQKQKKMLLDIFYLYIYVTNTKSSRVS